MGMMEMMGGVRDAFAASSAVRGMGCFDSSIMSLSFTESMIGYSSNGRTIYFSESLNKTIHHFK